MTIHKLRVILDTNDDIFRDIDIHAEATLMNLHDAIIEAFGIDKGEMASFYHTDDTWTQGEEIPMVDMGANPDAAAMDQVHVEDLLVRPGDRLLYVYDFLSMWTFFVEYVEQFEGENDASYPVVSLSYGETPSEAPSKDFSGEEGNSKKGNGLFGNAFGDEEEEDEDYDGDFNEDVDLWS